MASRLVLWLIFFLLFQNPAIAGQKYNAKTGAQDFCNTIRDNSGSVVNDNCSDFRVADGALTKSGSFYLLNVPYLPSGATSITTSQGTISTSYALTRKAISSDSAYSTGTLGNGRAGQILTVFITVVQGSGTWTLTPTTKTGFTSILFDAAKDAATFLYVDDINGWILISSTNVTVNIP